jgi:hypothetical protein
MCDKRICERKDYMDALRIPKDTYFKWREDKNIDEDSIRQVIEKYLSYAKNLHYTYGNQKLDITWNEYKNLINSFLLKCLNNYKPLDQYTNKNELSIVDIDYWTEDNYVIKYVGNSLLGYMKNYEKKHHGVSRKNNRDKRKYSRCGDCNKSFLTKSKSNNLKRCPDCQREKQLEWQRNSMKKLRHNVKLSNK